MNSHRVQMPLFFSSYIIFIISKTGLFVKNKNRRKEIVDGRLLDFRFGLVLMFAIFFLFFFFFCCSFVVLLLFLCSLCTGGLGYGI